MNNDESKFTPLKLIPYDILINKAINVTTLVSFVFIFYHIIFQMSGVEMIVFK